MDKPAEIIYISPLRKLFDKFNKSRNLLFLLQNFSSNLILFLKSRKVSVILLLILALVIVVSTFLLVRQQVDSSVAAKVNGKKISKVDYEKHLVPTEYFYKEIYTKELGENVSDKFLSEIRKVALENLIQEVILTQYFEDKGVKVSDDEVRDHVKKTVVDVGWKGDWQAYEDYLAENKTYLENIMSTFRRDLLIQKVLKIEEFTTEEFDVWYADLRAKSNVSTFIDLEES